MAIQFNVPPQAASGIPAIRTDRAVHGATIKQVTITMTAGSTTDYAVGGIVVTPANISMRQIWVCLSVSCQLGNGTAILIDPAWDHVNSKLALFLSQTTHNEITTQLTAGSIVRAVFLGV